MGLEPTRALPRTRLATAVLIQPGPLQEHAADAPTSFQAPNDSSPCRVRSPTALRPAEESNLVCRFRGPAPLRGAGHGAEGGSRTLCLVRTKDVLIHMSFYGMGLAPRSRTSHQSFGSSKALRCVRAEHPSEDSNFATRVRSPGFRSNGLGFKRWACASHSSN